MEPTILHVEPKLLPAEIVSLIGIPPALGGKLTALDNFVAEIAASCQSEQTSTTISPRCRKVGAQKGRPRGGACGRSVGALAAPSLAVEATADYDTQGSDLVPQVKAPGEVVPRGLAAPVRSFGGSSRGRHYYDT
jgi:hypothetical protein